MGSRYSDGANMAVRVFLRELGALHDKQSLGRPGRKLESKELKNELREAWGNLCAYCQIELRPTFDIDHIVPTNQEAGGLHCIANVVPACKACNRDKKQKSLREFVSIRTDLDALGILDRIDSWQKRWGGNPSGEATSLARQLYQSSSELIKSFVGQAKF